MIRELLGCFRRVYLLAVTGLVASCTLGPNFHRPPLPPVAHYTAEVLPKHTIATKSQVGKKQYFAHGQDVPSEWWLVFRSEPLNQLIQAALQANPDLKAANAALRVAQETALAQRAAFFPRADANLNGTRQETAHTLTPIVSTNSFYYTLNTPQLTISYVPDIFGLNRRQVESLEAQVETATFQREALALTITTNLVTAVIQEASLRAQIKITRRSISLGQRQLKMLRQEHDYGEIGLDGVTTQETVLAQLEASLPSLQKQLTQQQHLIAVLCGRFPSEKFLAQIDLDKINLPRALPVSLPSSLVEQRPDVRAAEAQLHAASAQIGVALAQRFPNILLTAVGGSAAFNWTTLFTAQTNLWGLTANLAQPVFDAGALVHKQRAAVAAYKQADAQYRSTVLSAFQDVANTLKAIQYDASNLKKAEETAHATRKSLWIAQQQWQAGELGYLAVINAEQTYQQALINLVQNQANRFSDTAALFQALGGGWWNRKLLIKEVVVVKQERSQSLKPALAPRVQLS